MNQKKLLTHQVLQEADKKLLFEKEDQIAAQADAISTTVFRHPELGNEERFTSKFLAEEAAKAGFKVTFPYLGIPTSFRAESGDDDGPAIAFLAEYDALPGYGPGRNQNGHACGHNWIAASTFAAAAALKEYKKEKNFRGRIVWLGCPAEETTSEKITLINRGAFRDIDAAFQMHLGQETTTTRNELAMTILWFTFLGKASHASGAPFRGINALDALNLTYQGIGLLRQQLKEHVRIHSTVREGGAAPNIIPDRTVLEVYVRSADKNYLEEVIRKVVNCARGACLMTGCRLEIRRDKYTTFDINQNRLLSGLLEENLQALGEKISVFQDPYATAGSSDIGNTSYAVPLCYAYMGTGEYSDAKTHDAAFLSVADSDFAHAKIHVAAKAMAAAALEVFRNSQAQALLRQVRQQLIEDEKANGNANRAGTVLTGSYDAEGNETGRNQ